jgi:DNA-binding CsgD family transcriptional regulator
VFGNLGVCVSVDFSTQTTTTPGMRAVLEQFHIRQALCVMSPSPAANLRAFLSLYRSQSTPLFSENERVFTQLTMPHVWATWTSNWISQVEHIRAHSSLTRMAHGIADRRATLHTAEPALIELLQREWPRWSGPTLPGPVEESVRSGLLVIGENIAFRALPVGGLYLIEASARSAIDRLTARELKIAEGFGRGRSYKELAVMLAVAPTTIRAHLRTIYAKLGVTDKAELATLLTNARDAGPATSDHASSAAG